MACITGGIGPPTGWREIIGREHGKVCRGDAQRVCGGEPHLEEEVADALVVVHEAQHVAAVALVPATQLRKTGTVHCQTLACESCRSVAPYRASALGAAAGCLLWQP